MKILVMDIGGSTIKYAFMDENGAFLSRGDTPTPHEGREEFMDAIASVAEGEGPLDGAAVSLPGLIDYETGTMIMGGSLTFNNGFALRDALMERLDVPKVILENDAKCAGAAEAASGALADVKDGVVLVIGTNIGGAIIHDRKVIHGAHSAAGEVTYIISDGTVPTLENLWGERGGVPGLLKVYREICAENGRNCEINTGRGFFAAYDAKDPEAEKALTEYARQLAVQIFNLQTIIDPDRFAIGGGISARPELVEEIREQLTILYDACPRPVPHAEVTICKYRNDANLIGAWSIFMGL